MFSLLGSAGSQSPGWQKTGRVLKNIAINLPLVLYTAQRVVRCLITGLLPVGLPKGCRYRRRRRRRHVCRRSKTMTAHAGQGYDQVLRDAGDTFAASLAL